MRRSTSLEENHFGGFYADQTTRVIMARWQSLSPPRRCSTSACRAVGSPRATRSGDLSWSTARPCARTSSMWSPAVKWSFECAIRPGRFASSSGRRRRAGLLWRTRRPSWRPHPRDAEPHVRDRKTRRTKSGHHAVIAQNQGTLQIAGATVRDAIAASSSVISAECPQRAVC